MKNLDEEVVYKKSIYSLSNLETINNILFRRFSGERQGVNTMLKAATSLFRAKRFCSIFKEPSRKINSKVKRPFFEIPNLVLITVYIIEYHYFQF
jgi:hypothetical protein